MIIIIITGFPPMTPQTGLERSAHLVRGNHLTNTTCLTHASFTSGE